MCWFQNCKCNGTEGPFRRIPPAPEPLGTFQSRFNGNNLRSINIRERTYGKNLFYHKEVMRRTGLSMENQKARDPRLCGLHNWLWISKSYSYKVYRGDGSANIKYRAAPFLLPTNNGSHVLTETERVNKGLARERGLAGILQHVTEDMKLTQQMAEVYVGNVGSDLIEEDSNLNQINDNLLQLSGLHVEKTRD